MTLTQLAPPYPIFTDKSGAPLDKGYLYFGTANLNPETNPIAVYYDSALTQPAAQPLRTSNGYVMRNGSPAIIYANSQFSVTVRDKNRAMVIYSPVGYGILPGTSATTSGQITYNQGSTGAVSRILTSRLQDRISVKDFGAVGDGVTNDTAAIQAAVNVGKRVYIPEGTYLCNVTISSKIIIEGDGSTKSILKPNNVATAALTYTNISDFWSFHSEVHGVGFTGIGTKTGVGFTFGATTQAGFFTNAQYANNVKFFGCRFTNLEKGVLFPFGNIGTEFYSCGFQSNKYGVYTKDNSAGGDPMHAGNKHFYAGEFSGNECGFYCSDNTDGFGGISFKDTIFETNLIAAYIYTAQRTYVPIKFTDVWFEENGVLSSGAASVTIDAWSGSTRSDQTLTKRTVIIDGNLGKFIFDGCGVFGDVYLKASNTDVTVNDCRVESLTANGGGPSTVDTPVTSSIKMFNPYSDKGLDSGDGIVVVGAPTYLTSTINSTASDASNRGFVTTQRSSKIASYGPSRAMSSALTSAATTSGSFILTGSVVSDGLIYASCNEFTRAAFGTSEYTRLNSPSSTITTSAGWYVFTLDFKRTAGNPKVYIWDQSASQFIDNLSAPALNKWYTFAGIGYSAGSQTLFLDFQGDGTTCTWRVSAYQIHRFDTREQAQSFLMSGAFAES